MFNAQIYQVKKSDYKIIYILYWQLYKTKSISNYSL